MYKFKYVHIFVMLQGYIIRTYLPNMMFYLRYDFQVFVGNNSTLKRSKQGLSRHILTREHTCIGNITYYRTHLLR